jgi:hypothetical protein
MIRAAFRCGTAARVILLPLALAWSSPAYPAGAAPARHAAEALGLPAGSADPSSGAQASPEVLAAINRWLAAHFDLPHGATLPRVEFVTAREIAMRRYGTLAGAVRPASSLRDGATAGADGVSAVLAVYDDRLSTIYLADTWTGHSPAELSVLVHEMVHHLQKVAGLIYTCPGARDNHRLSALTAGGRVTGRPAVRSSNPSHDRRTPLSKHDVTLQKTSGGAIGKKNGSGEESVITFTPSMPVT